VFDAVLSLLCNFLWLLTERGGRDFVQIYYALFGVVLMKVDHYVNVVTGTDVFLAVESD